MASESLQCKTLVLRVSIHCEGCKKKVKKVLLSVDGVYRCDIDARSNKATVAVTGNISADALVKRLRKSGKNAEQWPEEQTPPQQQPTGTESSDETKNQAAEPDKPGGGDGAEKPASGDVVTSAGELSNPKASPEEPDKIIIAGEAAKPAEDSAEGTNADADADGDGGAANHGAKEATAPEQWRDPKRKRKQQREEQEEEKPVDDMAVVMVTAAPGQGGHLPPPLQQQQQQPVHVVSYSVARPSASAAYYAAAPPQEHPHPYPCPPCCHRYSQSQPSPYSCYHQGHGHLTAPASAASPARDSYGDLFSDDNANSCSVM